MEFPITREQLQTYNVLEYHRKKQFDQHIKIICGRVELTVLGGKERHYKHMTAHIKHNYVQGVGQFSPILSDVLAKLKELFVDCKVLVDPLETYILIDWS